MKGKMIVKLLSKDDKKLYVEIETMYRKYSGYLSSKNEEDRLNIGRHRVDFEDKLMNDKKLMKNVCMNPTDTIDLNYSHNKRDLKLHLDKVYEGHYCGFSM